MSWLKDKEEGEEKKGTIITSCVCVYMTLGFATHNKQNHFNIPFFLWTICRD